MLTVVTNLYPRPDQRCRGLFNEQLVAALSRRGAVEVLVPVAAPNPWGWSGIRGWESPSAVAVPATYEPYLHIPFFGRDLAARHVAAALRRSRCSFGEAALVSWLYPDGVAACRVAASKGVPCWVMALGSDCGHLAHAARRRQILDALKGAAGVVCVAKAQAEQLLAAGVPAANVHVVANGVDIRRFTPKSRDDAEAGLAAEEVSLRPGERILFLGNLVSVKRPELALRVLRDVLAQHADAQLLYVGDGPLLSDLQAQVQQEGLMEHVQFLGRQPYQRVPDLIRACDVLLLTSRSEGMPNVVVEARACGIPVVATDVGACGEILAGHSGCSVAPVGDMASLASGVTKALGQGHSGTAAFMRSWDDMAGDILQLMGLPAGSTGTDPQVQ